MEETAIFLKDTSVRPAAASTGNEKEANAAAGTLLPNAY